MIDLMRHIAKRPDHDMARLMSADPPPASAGLNFFGTIRHLFATARRHIFEGTSHS